MRSRVLVIQRPPGVRRALPTAISLPRSHAQKWEQRPIVIASMVAERIAGTRDSTSPIRLATQRESLVKVLRSVAAIEGDQRQEFVK